MKIASKNGARLPYLKLLNKYAVNSFLQYCLKLVEPFGTTACTATAPSKTSVVKSGLTLDVSTRFSNIFIIWLISWTHFTINWQWWRLSMIFMSKVHHEQHRSWNIADNLALKMLLFSVFWIWQQCLYFYTMKTCCV